MQQNFSTWRMWTDRATHERLKSPGIYAIAISDGALSGKAFDLIEQIVYFGMTNSLGGLAGRLKQFDSSIQGGPGHGGAQRFLPDHPKSKDLFPRLYVSVWPFDVDVKSIAPENLLKMGDVCRAEYECWAEYSRMFKRLPKYNDKKLSPKLRGLPLAPNVAFSNL